MATFLKIVFVCAAVCTLASASCIKGGSGTDKEDKNVTKAGTDDLLKSGMHLKIEITLIYRKRTCMKCLLESMPKLNGLLITYIRGAILLRVVHQAIARLTLLQQSFQFVRFVRMARVQLAVLNRMKWAAHLRNIFGFIDELARAMIRFVHGEISGHSYVLIYRKFLLTNYAAVSHLLLTSLVRWKNSPQDLNKQRTSLYGLMMLTHLVWAERYLYERLINYEGTANVEKDRDDMMRKMQGFFVETKISFKYKPRSKVGATSNGYKVVNGRPIRENKPVTSLLDKWKNRNKKKNNSNKGSSMLNKWQNRKKSKGKSQKTKPTRGGSMLARWKAKNARLAQQKAKKKRTSLFARWKGKKTQSSPQKFKPRRRMSMFAKWKGFGRG